MISSKTHTFTAAIRSRTAVLAILAATGVGLFACGPANAAPKQTTGAGKGCTIKSIATGVTYTVPDGSKVTRNNADGTTQTQTCDNGNWIISHDVITGASGPPAIVITSTTAGRITSGR